jgi:predicted ester cyclase
MSITERFEAMNKQIISGGDLQKAGEYMADDFVFAGATPQPLGKDAVLGFWAGVRQAFPDFDHNVEDLVERDGKLYGTVAVSGTHLGDLNVPGLPTIPPTGKKVQLPRERIELSYRGDLFTEWLVEEVPNGGIKGILSQIGVAVPAH